MWIVCKHEAWNRRLREILVAGAIPADCLTLRKAMTLEEVYEYYGSANKAAKAVGVTRQSFYVWAQRGFIPFYQQKKFEKLSKGSLIAEANPEIKALADKPAIHFPHFRYYSEQLGMCEVKSLIFRDGKAPRIVYFSPGQRVLSFTSFNRDNLMQAVAIPDINGKYLFEGDIILVRNIELTFSEIGQLEILAGYEDFLIIGNIFEGKINGYS